MEIDERGSFSAAAAALGTVQSNVSARIARLERELDASLVDRAIGPAHRGGRVGRRARAADPRRGRRRRRRRRGAPTPRWRAPSGIGVIGTVGSVARPPAARRRARAPSPRRAAHRRGDVDAPSSRSSPSGQLDLAVVTLPLQVEALSDDATSSTRTSSSSCRPATRSRACPRRSSSPSSARSTCCCPSRARRCATSSTRPPRRRASSCTPLIELDGLRTLASLAFDGYGPALLPATAVPRHLRDRFSLGAGARPRASPRRDRGAAPRPARRARRERCARCSRSSSPPARCREGLHAAVPLG